MPQEEEGHMTVGELKEVLGDYGDFMQVVVVVERGGTSRDFSAFIVDTASPNMETRLEIVVEDA